MKMESDKETVRLFVAAFPSGAIVDALGKVLADWRGEFGAHAIRWTKVEQIHVTLAFIGSVQRERSGEFESAVNEVAQNGQKCVLEGVGVGCFPSPRNPRVLWAGLAGDLNTFCRLQENLEVSLGTLGYVPEKRAFHPHLTLGRVNQFGSRDFKAFERFLGELKETRFGQWQVERVDLMQSVLGPGGSRYSAIKSCGLNPGGL